MTRKKKKLERGEGRQSEVGSVQKSWTFKHNFLALPSLSILCSLPFYFSSFFYLKIRKKLDRKNESQFFLRSSIIFYKYLGKEIILAISKKKWFSKKRKKKGKFLTTKYHMIKKFQPAFTFSFRPLVYLSETSMEKTWRHTNSRLRSYIACYWGSHLGTF